MKANCSACTGGIVHVRCSSCNNGTVTRRNNQGQKITITCATCGGQSTIPRRCHVCR